MAKIEEKYARELVVIGIHSAKFPNERSKGNLYNAVRRYEIDHPVINDAQFRVWQQYACRAWPTLMFVDPTGKVVGKHEGELTYQALDQVISQMVAQFDNDKTLKRSSRYFPPPPSVSESLSYPGKVLADNTSKCLFIADTNHNQILITSLDGQIQNIVGSGSTALTDGSFTGSAFNHPQGLALKENKVYVADTGNHAIREINLNLKTVVTIAGQGIQGGPTTNIAKGTNISLNSPWDLTIIEEDLFIAMAGSHQLWHRTIRRYRTRIHR